MYIRVYDHDEVTMKNYTLLLNNKCGGVLLRVTNIGRPKTGQAFAFLNLADKYGILLPNNKIRLPTRDLLLTLAFIFCIVVIYCTLNTVALLTNNL